MATILPSNFLANTLSGTVSVTNGFANISLPTIPYALEGDKPFVIKLRRGSVQGDVIATSPTITLRDNSAIVSLTANISTVAEGNLVSLSLVTSNAANGSNVFFSVFPVTANVTASDFFGGNTGLLTINNNQATFALYANTDAGYVDETGETFKVQLRTVSPVGNIVYTTANIAITDFYKLYNAIGLVETVSTISEGSNVTFTFTGHNIPTGTILYYNTEGNATSSLFTTGNTGSFVMNGLSNTLNLVTTSTVPSQETRNFVLKLRSGSLTGAVVATSNSITVVDSTLAYVNATGGTIIDTAGYRLHAFTTSGNLQISSLGVGAYNTIDYLIVAGGGAGGGGYTAPTYNGGGGGGAGGLLTSTLTLASTGNTVITVGAGGGPGVGGGEGGHIYGPNGGNTTVSFAGSQTLVAIGGGGGGAGFPGNLIPGRSGGSGGGTSPGSGSVGTGTPGQGNPGGVASPIAYNASTGVTTMAGGGGGAGSAGSWKTGDPESAPTSTHAGGIGLGLSWIPSSYGTPGPNGSLRYFAGGGGGGGAPQGSAYILSGGAGGGGAGGYSAPGYPTSAYGSGAAIASADSGANAIINTGGGGGGVGSGGVSSGIGRSGRGGSGIVIIRYPYVPPPQFLGIYTLANAYIEGSNITFNVFATNANTYTYYYKTVGNVTASDFVGGNTGSFTANATGATITLQANSLPANETRFFALQITEDSLNGTVKATSSNIDIADSGLIRLFATGGTVTEANGYRTHTFTSSGNLIITTGSPASPAVEVLSIAGGGGGGIGPGGASGGGGGGFVYTSTARLNVGTVSVVVGAGGAAYSSPGAPIAPTFRGGNTTLSGAISSSITSVGGGFGGGIDSLTSPPDVQGSPGGSGGGAGPSSVGGSGWGFPGPTQQGYPGGTTPAAGGGGAGAAGGGRGPTIPGSSSSGAGGIGLISAISGGNVYYSGGGGGGYFPQMASNGPGGLGGGGAGSPSGGTTGWTGNVNTGGGGGGGGAYGAGGAGGSGIVIIRYPLVGTVFNGLTTPSSAVVAGSNILFTANITGANTNTYFYKTVGNVTTSDFIGGNTGSFTANATGGIITLRSNTTIPQGQTRFFTLQITEDSLNGLVRLESTNVTVYNSADYYISATGGNVFIGGGYKTHIFTVSNTFVVTAAGVGTVEYMLVAGGGSGSGGSNSTEGGGGAGGVLHGTATVVANTYTLVVGAGGSASNGGNTFISGATTIGGIAVGGGTGGTVGPAPSSLGKNGGSGGGGSVEYDNTPRAGGSGFGFPGTAGSTQQGYPGGSAIGVSPSIARGGGGGGAGAAGEPGNSIQYNPATRSGGIGISSPLSPSIPGFFGTDSPSPGRWFAGGGGGSWAHTNGGGIFGGFGGGGDGDAQAPSAQSTKRNGNVNTGGGGGGDYNSTGGLGGSGIIIIRYPYN